MPQNYFTFRSLERCHAIPHSGERIASTGQRGVVYNGECPRRMPSVFRRLRHFGGRQSGHQNTPTADSTTAQHLFAFAPWACRREHAHRQRTSRPQKILILHASIHWNTRIFLGRHMMMFAPIFGKMLAYLAGDRGDALDDDNNGAPRLSRRMGGKLARFLRDHATPASRMPL